MHDQVGQSEFENSDEDQIIQKDNFDYSSEQDRYRIRRLHFLQRQDTPVKRAGVGSATGPL